jgi:hypothetical protein
LRLFDHAVALTARERQFDLPCLWSPRHGTDREAAELALSPSKGPDRGPCATNATVGSSSREKCRRCSADPAPGGSANAELKFSATTSSLIPALPCVRHRGKSPRREKRPPPWGRISCSPEPLVIAPTPFAVTLRKRGPTTAADSRQSLPRCVGAGMARRGAARRRLALLRTLCSATVPAACRGTTRSAGARRRFRSRRNGRSRKMNLQEPGGSGTSGTRIPGALPPATE